MRAGERCECYCCREHSSTDKNNRKWPGPATSLKLTHEWQQCAHQDERTANQDEDRPESGECGDGKKGKAKGDHPAVRNLQRGMRAPASTPGAAGTDQPSPKDRKFRRPDSHAATTEPEKVAPRLVAGNDSKPHEQGCEDQGETLTTHLAPGLSNAAARGASVIGAP